jgi:diguanylate cyclase (GGDEF)-like protein
MEYKEQQNMELAGKNRNILVIDDNASIHNDIRTILKLKTENNALTALSQAIFPEEIKSSTELAAIKYKIDSAFQGQEGLELVVESLQRDEPYALAIVDMRMPPGWDGIETIKRIRAVDPHLQIAICTAYSDYSWEDYLNTFGQNDWLLIFKKPFDFAEVRQLACALTEKWNLAKQAALRMDELENMVAEHALMLSQANSELTTQNKSLHISNERLSKEIAARRLADERIRHIAYHDTLTDLPNRTLLMEQLHKCFKNCQPHDGYLFAILFIDVDDFKIVNDSLGHRAGDQLLQHIAQDLTDAIRSYRPSAESPLNMAARLGGDEFIVVLDNILNSEQAVDFAEQIQKSIIRPLSIEGKEIVPRISIGVAMSRDDYRDPADILRDADTALYHSKTEGKGRVELFDQDMRLRVTRRMDMEQDLRQAIARQEFCIHYQPIVSLTTGKIVSFEALVRWQHPTRGLISPEEFIPVAEETAIIAPLGQWILAEVCHHLSHWRTHIPGAENISAGINLSVRQLMREEIVDEIVEALDANQLKPDALKLEITESTMIQNSKMIVQNIEALDAHQLEFHVDDFGTGFSSLSVLHKLPVSAIKLDRSFVQELPNQLEFASTVQAMVMLTRIRHIQLIAEGVERFEQLVQLQALDCDLAQGFYFSRPVNHQDAERMLSTGKQFGNSKAELGIVH